MQRWFWLFIMGCGLLAGVNLIDDGIVWAAVLVLAVASWVAWWMFPWRGSRISHREAQELAAAEHGVVVYWRPGCQFCSRLRTGLGEAKNRATWVNIWRDPEAARFVREVNDGNEVVPTVVIDGTPTTNPPPSQVKAYLTERA